MIIPPGLPPALRDHARSTLLSRIERAETTHWRRLWESDLLLLDGRIDAALEILLDLQQRADATVATWASLSLGQWYDHCGNRDRAEQSYHDALARAPSTNVRLQVLFAQAELRNGNGQWQASVNALQEAVDNLTDCPEDSAQSLMSYYGCALLKLGRHADAARFFGRMIEAFPERTELPEIRDFLLRNPERDPAGDV